MIFNGDGNFILGNQTDDFITSTGNNATILAGKGDDIISTGSGTDTILYRKGDGADTIYDKGGSDTLKLIDISRDEITLHANKNDLIITLSNTDSITIKEYFTQQHRIETILFQDGTTLNFAEVVQTYFMDDTNNTITLTNASETINGYEGDDTIKALGGNDTLIGGKGNDTLEGGDGNDTYIFNRGDGRDTIFDTQGNDTLQLGEGISKEDLYASISKEGTLTIAIKESGKTLEELSDTITILKHTNPNHAIENILLSDGTAVDIASLQEATEGDDTVVFGNNGVIFHALGGNDHITSGSGADTIDGGEGNDTIITGTGNDTLIGGKGDDTLIGGLGDDTYIFNRGDGRDTIIDSYTYGYNNTSSQNAGNDTLKLGAGITKDDLLVTIVGSDIVVALKEEGKTLQELSDIITIKNGTLPNNAIENILLDDGTKFFMVELQEATEQDDMKNSQKYTTIKTNTKNYKTSFRSQEHFANIKKYFCTDTCQDGLWYVAVNSMNFGIEREVA